jgi:hypothetical protein
VGQKQNLTLIGVRWLGTIISTRQLQNEEPGTVCSEKLAGRNVGYEGSRPLVPSVVSVKEAVKWACRDSCDVTKKSESCMGLWIEVFGNCLRVKEMITKRVDGRFADTMSWYSGNL